MEHVLIPMELHSACDPFAAYDGTPADRFARMTVSAPYSPVAKATARKMNIHTEK